MTESGRAPVRLNSRIEQADGQWRAGTHGAGVRCGNGLRKKGEDYAATEISSHLKAQKRQASAHSLQNSFIDANRSHSAAQAWQVLMHS